MTDPELDAALSWPIPSGLQLQHTRLRGRALFATRDFRRGESVLEQDPLCARLTDEDEPSKIINAPCFLPNLLAGPYWVVAAGPSPQRYSWGIVSGGQPDVPAPDGSGCSNTEEGVNGSGFWLFSRSPTLSAQDLEDIRTVARMNGFALDRLRPGEYA